MTREKYESLSLSVLKELAKSRKLKGVSALRKEALIDRMMEEDRKLEQTEKRASAEQEPAPGAEQEADAQKQQIQRGRPGKNPERTEKFSEKKSYPGRRPDTRAVQGNQESPAERKSSFSGRKPEDRRVEERKAEEQRKPESHRFEEKKAEERRTEEQTPEEKRAPQAKQETAAVPPAQSAERVSGGGQDKRREYRRPPVRREESKSEQRSYEPRAEKQKSDTVRYESRPQQRQEPYRSEAFQEKKEVQTPETPVLREEEKPETPPLDSGKEAYGILEVMPDGFGFIRSDNYMPGDSDVYVSPAQIRRFGLKTGDMIRGNTRIKSQNEKFSALLYLKEINGMPPEVMWKRGNFEDMTPIFPNERLRLERPGGSMAMRIVDLVSPIGKGQRGMIVSPPKAGKTTLLKDAATSILRNNPEMHLIILLIDERPEEVTDIREAIQGDNVEVIYSTFDELPEHHKRVSEMVIERAKRLVEHHKDVTIFIDSITRLARAYNLTVPPSGRTLSGGLDPAALHLPKRFFGAARNMREGGSLTILATALVDTGSKMDDVVYEEFKGTGNMELILDRRLQEKRVFPAIDIAKSGTRREDLLLTKDEQEAVYNMRKALNGLKSDEAVENILNMFSRTRSNGELVQILKKQKIV